MPENAGFGVILPDFLKADLERLARRQGTDLNSLVVEVLQEFVRSSPLTRMDHDLNLTPEPPTSTPPGEAES